VTSADRTVVTSCHAMERQEQKEAAALAERDRALAERRDAYLDNIQDFLSGASVVLSVVSAGCLVASLGTVGVSAAPGFGLFVASALVTGLNVGITMYRQQTGFVDDRDAGVSYMLAGMSMVPVPSIAASVAAAALEWRD